MSVILVLGRGRGGKGSRGGKKGGQAKVAADGCGGDYENCNKSDKLGLNYYLTFIT